MVWKAKGDERGKSYAVYKDLERRFNVLQHDYDALQVELERKNATIRTLALELANYASKLAPGSSEVSEIAQHLVDAASEAPSFPQEAPRMQERYPVKPMAKAVPRGAQTLEERLAEVTRKAKGQ